MAFATRNHTAMASSENDVVMAKDGKAAAGKQSLLQQGSKRRYVGRMWSTHADPNSTLAVPRAPLGDMSNLAVPLNARAAQGKDTKVTFWVKSPAIGACDACLLIALRSCGGGSCFSPVFLIASVSPFASGCGQACKGRCDGRGSSRSGQGRRSIGGVGVAAARGLCAPHEVPDKGAKHDWSSPDSQRGSCLPAGVLRLCSSSQVAASRYRRH